MKKYKYFMAACILTGGLDVIFTMANLYACPRCRRAEPKGPRKRPHPGFPSSRPAQNQVSTKR